MSLYHSIICQLSAIYPEGEAKALARMLMEERFHLSLTDILMGKDSELSLNERTECQNIVTRLLKNEPIQYILGETEFCGLRIGVEPGVLIPRPETAELVEWISGSRPPRQPDGESRPPRVLDIGTGSGCIALALASRGFDVEAWDVSEDALRIARKNASSLGLDVRFHREDILQTGVRSTRPYSIIVSNPPYICQREASDMERNVLDYEPSLALFVPDDDPLLFYRAIARFARQALAPQGLLFFEINRAYSLETKQMLEEEGFTGIEIRQDQFGNDRMMKAQTNPQS